MIALISVTALQVKHSVPSGTKIRKFAKERSPMKLRIACVVVAFLSLSFSLAPLTVAQTSAQTASALPRLVRFGGTVKDLNGNALTGMVGVTFALYTEQTGGASLWLETQNVTADSNGHYTVLLGSTNPDGLPADLFTSEQAHWVGVQVSGQAEQPRVLLVSAPYALKAGDAETIGGLPPSAFVLAAPATGGDATASSPAASASGTVSPASTTDVTTTGGTADYLPIFSGAATVIDSVVFQTGTGATAKVGINTITPATTLDLNGTGTVRGTLSLPATGVATATVGKDSQGLNLVASSFSSTSSTALNQTFRWQAEPAANDTASPSGTLNLLYGLGATTPAETGLKLSNKGVFTFATGQTFPGTGAGTITGITTATGSGLAGGGTGGALTLSVPAAGITNAMLAHPSLTVTAGTDLTGGGPVALGDSITLSVNTAKIPQLSTANTFTASQTVDGNLTATGTVTAGTLNAANASISNSLVMKSAYGSPLEVTASSAGAEAIVGYASASTGEGYGVLGQTSSSDPAAYGVEGYDDSSTGSPIGVYGQVNSTSGTGVFGQDSLTESATGAGLASLLGFPDGVGGAGVWGDGGSGASGLIAGVVGTVDNGAAGYFVNNSPLLSYYTVVISNENATGYPLYVGDYSTGDLCIVDNDADLTCDGTVSGSAAVVVGGAKRKVALSAIESPQNWYEDAGAAELVNGKAVVTLDPEFIQTVNTGMDYKVFPVPNGDCKGLYVTNKTATSFEVRELGGGTASIRFDYRIMALRKNYENVRFADHTNDPDPMKQMVRGGHAAGAANRQSHTPTKKPSVARPLTQTTAVR
jgi:hypothetical protein